jgi:hypothetical protein
MPSGPHLASDAEISLNRVVRYSRFCANLEHGEPMSKFVKRRWDTTYSSGLPRSDRAVCAYEAYVPDPLMGRPVRLDGDVAADITDAETAVARFDARAVALADTEALARLLLRAEAVASSKIEGLEVGGRRLLRAEAATALGGV